MNAYPKKFLKGLYRAMVEIRVCEESFVDPILKGAVRCPVHLYSGEEAVAAGVCAALKKTDYLFGTHRSHGHFLAKGGMVRKLVAEVYCKEDGCSGGRGGSMHLIDHEVGMMGSVPIVAGTISLALGAALASHIRNDKRVTVSFFGDGATGEGVLFESMNFAALKKLPLIFVCENNLYSTHMPIDAIRPNRDIFKIAQPFGIRSFRSDGNDVLAVYETAKKAVGYCRAGKGPVFIELLTYRLRGHVGPDDNIQGTRTDIRPLREVEAWRRKDPIARFEKLLIRDKMVSKGDIAGINRDARHKVQKAHARAQRTAHPAKDALTKYVFKG